MDRKSIAVIAACLGLIVLWSYVVTPKYFTKPGVPALTNASTATLNGSNAPAAAQPAQPTTTTAQVSEPTHRPMVGTNVPEQLLEVTNSDAHYTFTSHGGGLKMVELLKYPETVSTILSKSPDTNRVATLNAFTPAPTLALLGGEALEGDDLFTLTRTATGVRRSVPTPPPPGLDFRTNIGEHSPLPFPYPVGAVRYALAASDGMPP